MPGQRLQLTWYNKDKALIPIETGRYGYAWVDPDDPRYCETHTLVMDEYIEGEQTPKKDDCEYTERADLEPQRDNLMIYGESGDVLEALTRVPELAEKYVGNVKLVYIDPPFNTEQSFESYEDNLEHSIWLTMMRDRLLNLKQLLAKDGSIWVHLDDSENHRMRSLLDESFGPGNFIAEIAWEKTFKPRNDAGKLSSRHDTILVYRVSDSTAINGLPRTVAMDSAYSNRDNDPEGPWKSDPITAADANTHQGMVYGIQQPITGEILYPSKGRHWAYGQVDLLAYMNQWAPYRLEPLDDIAKRADICGVDESELPDVDAIVLDVPLDEARKIAKDKFVAGSWPFILITKNGNGGFRHKTYLKNLDARVPEDMWFTSEVGSNDEAKNEIKALFRGATPFKTPKPERLLERIIHIATNPGDIVLDCFAGSATTAAVAQKMGRRWVTCELLDSNYNAYDVPRLTKVVSDEDPGGITALKPERVAADGVDLPDGVSPDDAAKFTSVLNKLIANNDELKKCDAVKTLKKMAKTQNTKTKHNWRGGGGFQTAHLSPACFDYDPDLDRVVLTDDATGRNLVISIAANLGFYLIPDQAGSIFDGYKGRSLLKVYEGFADNELVDTLIAQLEDGQTLTLAATGVIDGTREHLRRACKGSRLLHIPDDIFSYSMED